MTRSSIFSDLDQTMADLDISVKFALSHRGLAFADLLPRLIP